MVTKTKPKQTETVVGEAGFEVETRTDTPIRVPVGGDMEHPAIAEPPQAAGLMVEGRATQRTTQEVKQEVQACLEDLKKVDAGVNKSQKIRYLAGLGHSRSAIANALNIRYQHVRNVLIAPVKRPDLVAAAAGRLPETSGPGQASSSGNGDKDNDDDGRIEE